MRRPPAAAPLLLAALTTGCGPETLAQSWQLDRLRVLAVRAEPAEPRPGDPVSFSSLVYTPAGVTLTGTIWFACLPEGADDFGCELDPALLEAFEGDLESLTPEEQAELFERAVASGFVGFDPFFPPVWVTPADALDGLDDAAAREGVSAIVNVTALGEAESGPALDAEDPNAVELAYKRIPISVADTPNHNPDLTGFTVYANPRYRQGVFVGGDAIDVADGVLNARGGDEYRIEPTLPEDDLETYTFIDSDGVEQERTEEPFVTWYTEGGSFGQTFSLHPFLGVSWTAPRAPFDGAIVAVVRDRRGGMGWATLRVVVGADR